jgi:hypothetical protein
MSTARAWWSARSKWKWLLVIVVLYVAIGVPVKALTAHHHAATPIGPITAAMTSRSSTFWQWLGSAQRVELAAGCRSQLATEARQSNGDSYGDSAAEILSFTPQQLATEVDRLYADYSNTIYKIRDACAVVISGAVQARQNAASDAAQAAQNAADAKQQRILASVQRGSFRATDASVRAYMTAAQIGQSTRTISCIANSCSITFDDYDPTSHPILDKIFGTTSTPETELIMPMTQLFSALFSDPYLQRASLTSWINFQTIGGKVKRWPALTVSCDRAADKQIDWNNVTPAGLQQLCAYSLLPDGSPR